MNREWATDVVSDRDLYFEENSTILNELLFSTVLKDPKIINVSVDEPRPVGYRQCLGKGKYSDINVLARNIDFIERWATSKGFSPKFQLLSDSLFHYEGGLRLIDKLSFPALYKLNIDLNSDFLCDYEKSIPETTYYSSAFPKTIRPNAALILHQDNVDEYLDKYQDLLLLLQEQGLHIRDIDFIIDKSGEWSLSSIKSLKSLIEVLIWLVVSSDNNDCLSDLDSLSFIHDIFFDQRIFWNIAQAPIKHFCIRGEDLAILPHFRLSNRFTEAGWLMETGEIKAKMLEFYFSAICSDPKTFPYCSSCAINNICPHGCLHQQQVTTGEAFVPIQTQCRVEHLIATTVIDALNSHGLLGDMIAKGTKDISIDIERIERIKNGH